MRVCRGKEGQDQLTFGGGIGVAIDPYDPDRKNHRFVEATRCDIGCNPDSDPDPDSKQKANCDE